LGASDLLYIGVALYVAEPGLQSFTAGASFGDLFF
jgi:hypothetical protein